MSETMTKDPKGILKRVGRRLLTIMPSQVNGPVEEIFLWLVMPQGVSLG